MNTIHKLIERKGIIESRTESTQQRWAICTLTDFSSFIYISTSKVTTDENIRLWFIRNNHITCRLLLFSNSPEEANASKNWDSWEYRYQLPNQPWLQLMLSLFCVDEEEKMYHFIICFWLFRFGHMLLAHPSEGFGWLAK